MNNDHRFALTVGLLSTTLLWKPVLYPVLEFTSHSMSLVILGLLFVYLFVLKMPLTAVVLAGVGLYLIREWSTYTKTPERQMYLDSVADDIRFEPGYSVDLQSANKTLGFDAPSMLQPPLPHSEPLLTYPPSEETLRSLNG
jgi:hypothetical protein